MSDNIQEMQGLPVNSDGCIVSTKGTGTDEVTGYLPAGFSPLNITTKGLPIKFPDEFTPKPNPVYLFPALDIQDRTPAVAMSTVAGTVWLVPTKLVERDGITYDTATGVFTFTKSGIYTHQIFLNIIAPANRLLYSYAEVWNGTAWVASTYSLRQISVTTATDGQVGMGSTNYFAAGTQMRFTLWASGACQMASETVGTNITPAARIMYTGQVAPN